MVILPLERDADATQMQINAKIPSPA